MRQTLTTDNSFIFLNLSTIFSLQQVVIFVLEYKFNFLESVPNLGHCNGIFKCKSKRSSGNKKITVCTSKKSLAKELLFESSFLIVHDMPILKWYHLFL